MTKPPDTISPPWVRKDVDTDEESQAELALASIGSSLKLRVHWRKGTALTIRFDYDGIGSVERLVPGYRKVPFDAEARVHIPMDGTECREELPCLVQWLEKEGSRHAIFKPFVTDVLRFVVCPLLELNPPVTKAFIELGIAPALEVLARRCPPLTECVADTLVSMCEALRAGVTLGREAPTDDDSYDSAGLEALRDLLDGGTSAIIVRCLAGPSASPDARAASLLSHLEGPIRWGGARLAEVFLMDLRAKQLVEIKYHRKGIVSALIGYLRRTCIFLLARFKEEGEKPPLPPKTDSNEHISVCISRILYTLSHGGKGYDPTAPSPLVAKVFADLEKQGGTLTVAEIIGTGPAGNCYPHLRYKALQVLGLLVRSEGSRILIRQHASGATLDALISSVHGAVTAGRFDGTAAAVERAAVSDSTLIFSRLMWDPDFFSWAAQRSPSLGRTRADLIVESSVILAISSAAAVVDIFTRLRVSSLQDIPINKWTWQSSVTPRSITLGTSTVTAASYLEITESDELMEDYCGEAVLPHRMGSRAWLVLQKAVRFGSFVAERLASDHALVSAALTMICTSDADADLCTGALGSLANFCVAAESKVGTSVLAALRNSKALAAAGAMKPHQDPFASLDKAMFYAQQTHEESGNSNPTMVCMRLLHLIARYDELFEEFEAMVTIQAIKTSSSKKKKTTHNEFLIGVLRKKRADVVRQGDNRSILSQSELPHNSDLESDYQRHQYPQEVASSLKSCANPDCSKIEASKGLHKSCSACKSVYYCGSKCQKLHWKQHKTSCKKVQKKASSSL